MKDITDLFKKELFAFSIIFLFAAIGMFAKLGDIELQPLGSAAHAAISREILRTNKWLTPCWPHCEEFKDIYHHPPLFFWLQALTFKILGISDLTAKLVSSFFGFLVILITYYLGKLLVDHYTGFLSAMTLILTPFLFKHSRKCELETILIFFLTLAFVFFILAERKNKKYFLLSGLATGLGLLSKGPPAAAFWASVGLYYLLTKQYKKLFQIYFLCGILISILIPLFWIVPQLIKSDLFYQKYIVGQVLWKIAGGDRPKITLTEKLSGYLFYFGIFFSYFLPWSLTGVFGVYKIIKQKLSQFYVILLWTIVVWIGFTFAGYRDDYYLLALWPGWVTMNGFIFKYWTEKIKGKVVCSAGILMLFFIITVLFTPIKLDKVRNPEFKILSPYIKTTVPENEKIIIYKLYYWDMVALFPWYADRGVTHSIETAEQLLRMIDQEDKKFLFIKISELENLPANIKDKIYPIYICGQFILASNQKIKEQILLQCN